MTKAGFHGMYVFMYNIYIYIYIYIYTYAHTQTHTHTYIIHVCMHAYIHSRTHMHACIPNMMILSHTYTHTYTHAFIPNRMILPHACTHTYTHACITNRMIHGRNFEASFLYQGTQRIDDHQMRELNRPYIACEKQSLLGGVPYLVNKDVVKMRGLFKREKVELRGEKIILAPYQRHHVERCAEFCTVCMFFACV
jgi:hypothetical protein